MDKFTALRDGLTVMQEGPKDQAETGPGRRPAKSAEQIGGLKGRDNSEVDRISGLQSPLRRQIGIRDALPTSQAFDLRCSLLVPSGLNRQINGGSLGISRLRFVPFIARMVSELPDLDADFQQRLAAFAHHCELQTEAGLEQERSLGTLQNLARHIRQITDEEIQAVRTRLHVQVACKPGCEACCFRTAAVSMPELIEIVNAIDKLPEPLTRHVKDQAADYNGKGSPCPLLHRGECLLYEKRPLSCRGINSTDSEPCQRWRKAEEPENLPILAHQDAFSEAASFGLRAGLLWEGLDHEALDLGRALQWLYEGQQKDLAQGFFAGSHLPKSVKLAHSNDPLAVPRFVEDKSPAFRSPKGTQEPTGRPPKVDEESLAEYNRLALEEAGFEEAIAILDPANAAHAAANIVVPRVYRNEELITWWREHFIHAMRDFKVAPIPNVEKFNALSIHRTAGLAYQGMIDLDIMVEHGQICSEIAGQAVPDLLEPIEGHKLKGKFRLGYLSANMHGNNGCRWALGWLKHHGPDIETYAFNVGTVEDKISKEFRDYAHHYFHLVRSIVENARFIRSLQLDAIIITDIGLHGFNATYAALRMAPIQCTGWGHPVTSGYSTIDCYLSSELMEPEDGDNHYSEKLVRLPGSGLCYEPIEKYPRLDRAHFGLPEAGPLIVNVQTKPKLLPQHDHLYVEIAERVKAPVVFLEGFHPCDTIVTKERMAKAGVRTHWLPALKRPEFLALLALADVSLDPPLWSGGNTTLEALSAGTPVITFPGPFMRARHSLAFLQQSNAGGLIAQDDEDYVDLACNEDRRREAIKHLDADALFQDLQPVKALEEHLFGTSQPPTP